MSFANPTPLRTGATGTLNGWSARVAGRVVLSVEVEGDTYYWNEYNLVDPSGNRATLVFEEGEEGAEWKLFRAFTPLRALGVAEAAAKKVGDRVDLDGTPLPITLVDQSRVCFIEGEPPEGVEVGDVANYFNVDTGERMLVASWTDDEIEFYEGLDAPAEAVADAFQIPRKLMPGTGDRPEPAARASFTGAGSGTGTRWFTKLILPLFAAFTVFGGYSCFRGCSVNVTSSPPKVTAPALVLASGAEGRIGQEHFVIDGQAVVEVARRTGVHARREYHLRGDNAGGAILINGLSGGSKEWHLFRALPVPAGLTPHEAATRRIGGAFSFDGGVGRITDLFQAKSLSAEGAAGTTAGAIQYGLVAKDGPDWLIARWNEQRVDVLRGVAVPESDVVSGLGKSAAK